MTFSERSSGQFVTALRGMFVHPTLFLHVLECSPVRGGDAGRGRRSKQAAHWERLVCAHSWAHGLTSQGHSLAHTLKEAPFNAACKMFFLGQASSGL